MKNLSFPKKPKIRPNAGFGHIAPIKTSLKYLIISFLKKRRVQVGKEIISR